MIIQITNRQRKIKKSFAEKTIIKAAEVICEQIPVIKDLKDRNVDPVVSLLLTNDEELRRLNLEYRGKDAATDVLSFPSSGNTGSVICEFEEADIYEYPDGHRELELGDIAISVHTAIRQAEEIGNTVEAEIRFLFIHAFLHLLGHDHNKPEDEERMTTVQKHIISFFGKGDTNEL